MIYIHIPFCKSKCFYCGFYSTVSGRGKKDFLAALAREFEMRKDYLGKSSETLYLGGGTPSSLETTELQILLETLENFYQIEEEAEKTIEVNPEDILKIKDYKNLGFNRLSIGIQSFNNNLLKEINRRHTAQEATQAVCEAFGSGIENISIDLMLGLPGQKLDDVEKDLETALKLPVNHISLYILSIDEGSAFEKFMEKNKLVLPEDEEVARMYLRMSEKLQQEGFEHYEISNFARNGMYSRHNTGYWQQKTYIGFGPSAHSYDGISRQWNVSDIKTYTESLNRGSLIFEDEKLNKEDRYNEYVMTSLRTMWGADLEKLQEMCPGDWPEKERLINKYIREGVACLRNKKLSITPEGWLISDKIFRELFAG